MINKNAASYSLQPALNPRHFRYFDRICGIDRGIYGFFI